jgi:hypothetical protein
LVARDLVVEGRGIDWQNSHVTCKAMACDSVSDVLKQLLPMRQRQNMRCRGRFLFFVW